MRERIKHEYFTAPKIEEEENGWFSRYGKTISSGVFVQKDIRLARLVIASMLTEAWDERRFCLENRDMEPEPDEIDRMRLIAHLQHLASLTGLLNGEEIRSIQREEGKMSLAAFMPKEVTLRNFEEVEKLTEDWKTQGLRIGLFHGAFDPPTVLHLACATEAYTQCDRLLIGFEGDISLKKAKGEDRPRYPLEWRREVFASFWMVDETFVLSSQDYQDVKPYVRDYQNLNVNYVFLAADQEEKEKRLLKIKLAGAEPKYLYHRDGAFTATAVLGLLKKRGEI